MEPTLEMLENWARQAGGVLRKGFRQPMRVRTKEVNDLVTELDERAEAVLIQAIRQAFPGHAILSEESGEAKGRGGCWIIDPLDGTLNFAHGIPFFAVSLAYAEEEQVRLGVVYAPLQDECFSAGLGQGARLNGRPIRVSKSTDLLFSLVSTSFSHRTREECTLSMRAFTWLAPRVQGLRRMGSAALELAWLAAGRLDGLWDMRMNPWDVAAGALIACEAGAVLTDLEGGEDYLVDPCNLVAANPALYPALMGEIRKVMDPDFKVE